MIIGVISDTHDTHETALTALQLFASHGVQLVIHCGDWKSIGTVIYFAEQAAILSIPVKAVLGNNDVAVQEMLDYGASAPGKFEIKEGIFEFQLADKKCAIYHGHHAPTLRNLRASQQHDFIFLGHTHKPLIETIDTITIINPGSTAFAIPRSKLWKPTVAILDTVDGSAALHEF